MREKKIKIVVSKGSGFCFGVKRAIDIAFKIAKKNKGVYTLGSIIHNPQVIERLQSKGVFPVDDINHKNINTLLIRTHGITKELSKKLSNKKYKIIDTTCPFVKKAQQYAKLLADEGYQVFIIGNKEHPEVKSLISYAGKNSFVVNDNHGLENKIIKSKVGIIIQTTQSIDFLKKITNDILDSIKELKIFNTICSSTSLRLKETKEIAKESDIIIVVGGKNSANTAQLAKLCISMNIPTYHIETPDEIEYKWFKNVETVGITAGASTPDWIIKEVEEIIYRKAE